MEISYGEIFGWAGGTVAIISGLANWIGQLVTNRKNESWRGKTETDLKIIENRLSEKSSIINGLIDLQKSNYNFSQERRIKSVEQIWEKLQNVKKEFPSVITTVYNILTRKEIENFNDEVPNKNSIKFLKMFTELELDSLFASLDDFRQKLFCERPFLGDNLFSLVNIYSVFLGRLLVIIQHGFVNNNYVWQKDQAIVSILKSALTQKELAFVLQQESNSYNIATEMFESKIILQITDVLSGKVASNNSLEHIKHFKYQIEALQKIKES
ncbi:hypothetical protein [uncultured Chryseobacterium sp.]|uniref:hypothetical protein n=1 Tax=uncultured Chryseobacterium sp. TaxID=259322 RepID=UPI003747BF1A